MLNILYTTTTIVVCYLAKTNWRIHNLNGMVWEAYHKGVPLLGVPGITLNNLKFGLFVAKMNDHLGV